MAEMVKSGFPLPPEAVIMASPLSNKDKIIKMMKEQPQISPQHQKQMEEAQKQMEELQKKAQQLAEENQALKQDTQTEQAKLQFSAQEAKMKLEQKQAESQAELQLKAQTQAAELQLEREKAEAQIELERLKADAQLQLQGIKQQGDQQNQTAKLEFEQKCRTEDEAHKTSVEVAPQVVKMLEGGLAEALTMIARMFEENAKMNREILLAVKAPKDISVQYSDGRPTGATVRTLN
jgi:hypothetical protein